MISRFVRHFSNLSERYSTTLFKVASESKELEKVTQDMSFLKELYESSPDFKVLVANPSITRQQLTSIMGELIEKGGFAESTKRILDLLTSNKRLGFLPEVAKDFEELLKAQERKEVVKVVAAEELTQGEKKEVEAALKEFDKSKNYELTFAVDKDILGGLQLYFPTVFMDLSLRSRLDKIKDEVGSLAG